MVLDTLNEELVIVEKTFEPCEETFVHPYIPLKTGEKLRIAFLFQISSLWPNWKTLWEACLQDNRVDAKLVLIGRTYLDTKLHFLNEARNFLIENNIPFVSNSAFSLKHYLPHVVFIQTPYDDTLSSEYSLDVLRSLGCRLAYIPYGIEIGGGATNLKYQFNMPVQQQAWRIFARSERHMKMYAKYCSAGSAHVAVTGHPRIDLIQKLNDTQVKPSLIEKINGRKVILWCPHFSILKDQWSTFLIYSDYILNYFSNHYDLFLIVRPHPLLFSRLRDQANWNNEKIADFKNSIECKLNAYYDAESDYFPSFKVSDAILMDAGSFLLEYFSTGKPVAYLHNSDGPGLNDDGEIIKHFYQINTTQDIDAFLMMIAKNKDPKKETRCKAIPDYLYQNDKGIGILIKDTLLNSIDQYDRPVTTTHKFDVRHKIAEEYWKKATNTYLALPDYYDKQEQALRKLLTKVGMLNSALDIGCGDGRFTQVISQHAKHTKAIDISSELIAKAKNTLPNSIELAVESVSAAKTCHRYDLISCMGVTSGLIDDEVFLRTLDILVASCKPGGYLLMKDSLSLGVEQYTPPNEQGYMAIYRNIDDYLNCFFSRGYTLIDQHELFCDLERKFINRIFLFATAAVEILEESFSLSTELNSIRLIDEY